MRLTATSPAAAAPPSAGDRQVDLEPGATVALAGTGGAVGAWTQTAGPAVSLAGSGTSRTYPAPLTLAGAVMRFSYAVAGQAATVEHVVLPATERVVVGGVEVPVLSPYQVASG